jgi:crotonobetainyl-CoA:carnitine CoA-transferase CaiB-like acyl-CoA transferase
MTSLARSPTRPLDGFRVLDLTANVAGPLACQVLCDLGADVLKVEPDEGEAARRITATVAGFEHVTPYFSPNNRGKKSVRLDLSRAEGSSALRRLIKGADVVVQGMRPGTMERHGLGPAQVAEINPRCVYVSISAYGGGSELEDRPGIDMIVQAEAGCLSGQPQDRLPTLIPFQLVDGATGHVAAQAVLAALLHRERFGVVNQVKVSMYDVACSLQSNYLTLHMNTPTQASAPPGNGRRPVAVEPSGVYLTGQGEIVLAAYVPAHWKRLVELLQSSELAADPRFADQGSRSRHAKELRAALTDILRTRSAEEWVTLFAKAGLMAAHITPWRDVVESELFARRGMRLRVRQAEMDVDVVRTPALYSGFDTTLSTDIPAAGEHDSALADPRVDAWSALNNSKGLVK